MSRVKRGKQESQWYEGYFWELPGAATPDERLCQAAARVCGQYMLTKGTDIQASFYPYVGLKSTFKVEHEVARIKISDVLQDAPTPVLEALVHVLIARALRRSPRQEYLRVYDEYTTRPEIEQKHAKVRVERSRKKLSGTKGKVYDLDEIFVRINREYFNNELLKPNLSWSQRRSKRLLGYHDGHLNLVVISRWLDRRAVPPVVVDFIMYHELLHIVVPTQVKNGRRVIHSKEFKQRERQFRYYEEAHRWLSQPGLGTWE